MIATADAGRWVPDHDLEAELRQLRYDLFRPLVSAVLIVGWGWFSYVVLRGWELGSATVIMAILGLAAYTATKLGTRRYRLACLVLLLGMVATQNIIVATHPQSLAPTTGVLIIIVANALLQPHETVAVAVLVWASNAAVLALLARGGVPNHLDSIVDLLALDTLALATSWLMTRPLRTSVAWALSGWARVHHALEEVRTRRGELYRALRTLEEATYRIERMNNELILEQQRAEGALAVKTRFAATVSHELRGPLNLILGFSRLMALSPESYGEPLPRAYRADIYTIYRNTQHIVSMIDDILDLSQVEAQKLTLVKDRIDIQTEVVERALADIQPLIERKGLYLRREVTGDLPPILADPVRLYQALMNLLTNATRFTERGGITVRVARVDDAIQISVQDTGAGIPAGELSRLFREFHQVHQTPTRESRGTGLGLCIAKSLIELHDGRIWVESTEGVGTTFHFVVPLQTTASPADAPEGSGGQRHSKHAETCLVVHDDPAAVRVLARYIDDYRIVGLPDATEVVALTGELYPRAIVTTPEMAERIEGMLAHLPNAVPIISCQLPRVRQQLDTEMVVSYLIKPVMAEALMAVMGKLERDPETTVLLVEDEPDAARLLERMLLSFPRPYRILKARDGVQALEVMATETPDVVLMDIAMPEMDGWQTMERMQADERLRSIPVIIVSAQDTAQANWVISAPLQVCHRRPIDIARGADCLRALMTSLAPHYSFPEAPQT